MHVILLYWVQMRLGTESLLSSHYHILAEIYIFSIICIRCNGKPRQDQIHGENLSNFSCYAREISTEEYYMAAGVGLGGIRK